MFPERYRREGFFDGYVASAIRSMPEPGRNVPLIGGGTTGCLQLRQYGATPWQLDPFVPKPAEAEGELTWQTEDDEFRFYLVVLRGSINYLAAEELAKIANFMGRGGTLLANTFGFPPEPAPLWSGRAVKDATGGDCQERSQYLAEQGWVRHQLLRSGDATSWAHYFYYRAPNAWLEWFPNAERLTYGDNSLLLRWRKPCRGE